MDFWIGASVAVFALVYIFFRGNSKNNSKKRNPLVVGIAIIACIIGVIGYVFLGWRF